jgi:hypothetical protein
MSKSIKIKNHGLSKRGQTRVTKFLPEVEGVSEKLMKKISMSLELYKSSLSLYKRYKDTPELEKMFRSLSRNPLFDVTGTMYFQTGAYSNSAWRQRKDRSLLTKDHFFQRTKALKELFETLMENPNMSTEEYIEFLRSCCSTVFLTKIQHAEVNLVAKQRPTWTNHKIYNFLGIKFHNNALNEFIKTNKIVRKLQRAY